jgi:2-keto-4-pentenoate hydratase/2-oxohepta-3-ene-1,7-dioic acid hydratase in catechol pathway
MKLVTFQIEDNGYRIGALVGDRVVDLNRAYRLLQVSSDVVFVAKMADLLFPANMIDFFKTGEKGMQAATEILFTLEKDVQRFTKTRQPILFKQEEVKLLAPVPRPNTIRDFSTFEENQKRVTMKKSGGTVPDVWYQIPVYWKANPDNTIGSEEDVWWPKYSEKLDFELEFGIFIGKQGMNIPLEKAGEYIAGYTIFNDISARDQQAKEMVMTFGPSKGKDFDHSKIFGPCLVTPDEFGTRPHKMTASINGEVWGESSTDQMYYSFAQLITYVSQSESLYPGDFLGSGTCPGGCGVEVDCFLKPNDLIELEVEGIGLLRNRVVRKEG